MTSLLVALAVVAGGLLFLVLAWRIDSDHKLLFTPFLIFSINEITRNWTAGIAAPFAGITADFMALHVMVLGYACFAAAYMVAWGWAGNGRRGLWVKHKDELAAPGGVEVAVVIVGIVAFTLVGLALYRGVPPTVQALASLARGSSGAAVAMFVGDSREALTKGHLFGGEYRGQGALTSVLEVGWPLLLGIVLAAWMRARRFGWGLAVICVAGLAFAFVAGSGTRGPFLWTAIYLIVMVSMLHRVRWTMIAAGGLGIVALAIGLSVLSPKLSAALASDSFLTVALQKIGFRIFLANGFNTIYVVELVRGDIWDLRMGLGHVQRLANAIPGVEFGGVNLAHELYRTLNPYGTATTNLSATYFAEVFLDWGIAGVCVVYATIGMIAAFARAFLWQISRTPLTAALSAYLILMIGRFSLTGPFASLALLLVFCACATLFWLAATAARAFLRTSPGAAKIAGAGTPDGWSALHPHAGPLHDL